MKTNETTLDQTKHIVTNNDKQVHSVFFLKFLAAFALFLSLSIAPSFCSESNTFTMNFKPTEMFKWAQMVLDMMMPVLYITLGVSLAFIVIRALKSAFR